MTEAHRGYLLVADISGYTNYLSASELEHAHGTLTDLLELLIDRTRPPLVIDRLEGDAVISYGLDGELPGGQAFVESIEETYVAFRRMIDLMILNNKCGCNACANVSSLDLKFFVHHGSFLFQRLGDGVELLGTDVILIHRLMKNSVVKETGILAYCMYTDAAVEALGIGEYSGLMSHIEHADDFGDVQTWVQDMHPVWERRRDEGKIVLDDSEMLFDIEADIRLAPEVVWDYMTRPEFRTFLIGSDRQTVESLSEGRVGPGTTYLCYHGKRRVIPQTILEWEPFERIVTRDEMGKPLRGSVIAEYRLTPTDGGTHLLVRRGRADVKGMTRFMLPRAAPTMKKITARALDDFVARIEADWDGRTQHGREAVAIDPAAVAAAADEGLARLRAE